MAELGIAVAGVSAASSVYGAYAQNRALQSAAGSQREAAQTGANQVATQGRSERDQNRRVADQVAARTRVLSIASGGSGGDTLDDLDRTIAFDAGRNASNSRYNEGVRINAIRTNANANIASMKSQMRSVLLEAIGAGISGFATGLQIDSAGREAGWWK